MSASWPMTPRIGRAWGGNRQLAMLGTDPVGANARSQASTSGALCHTSNAGPNNDGPSRTPATISPTTRGCPARMANAPHSRAATMMSTTPNNTNAAT